MMEFDGTFTVDASREETWKYLNDPDILQDAAPGCEEVTLESPSQVTTTLTVGVGSVKPTFEVDATIVDTQEPERIEVKAVGQASRNSFEVRAWEELEPADDGGTIVNWHAEAEVSGLIASMGQRALGSVADKLVTEFFENIEDHINAGTPAEAQFRAVDEDEEAPEAPPVEEIEAAPPVEDQAVLYAAAGFVAGVVSKSLWDWYRGGADDEDEEDTGRSVGWYVAIGIAGAVGGKLLWDRFLDDELPGATIGPETIAGDRSEPMTEQGEPMVEREADEPEVDEADTEREAADVEDDDADGDDATEDDAAEDDPEEEEGMIDNPLDRLG